MTVMKLEEHCRQAIETFGRPWLEVHEWLDAFAGSERYGMRHRRVRHHEAGIREAVRLFGPGAGAVARQHIASDLSEEGWQEGVDPFPRDMAHYMSIGLF